MTVEVFEDPGGLLHITCSCKICHTQKQAQRDWRMHSQPTKRKGGWGILHSWSYRCLTCNSLIVVRWWQTTPSEPMFDDEWTVKNNA